MTKHSNIVGGSTAGRLLNCPGSFKAVQALPPSVDKSSVYAEEGTFAHAVMERVLKQRKADAYYHHPTGMYAYAEKAIGKKFHDRVMTRDHYETMIAPGIAALADLEMMHGGGFDVAAIELRVQFPGIPGAYGTCDLVLTSNTHAIVFDWKFGQGVPVKAVYYHEDDTEELNAQLMYYLAGALNTKPKLFGKRQLVIAIVQPRTDEPLTHTVVTRNDVKMFREDVENAVLSAIDRDPPLKKGEHCRWCTAKIACPRWTAPILGLADAIGEKVLIDLDDTRTNALDDEIRHTLTKPVWQTDYENYAPKPKPEPLIAPAARDHLPRIVTPYGQYLAKAKAFVDLLAPYTKAVNDQLHTYLEDGGAVPGWRLKEKAKNRQWVDEEVVVRALVNDLQFPPDEVYQQPKLLTFQSADAIAKKLGVKIPDALRVAPPSTETTIAPTNDPAPVVDRLLIREEFIAALKKLT